MAETLFRDYTKEKGVHISGLLADLMNQVPVTADTFSQLEGRIMLILPDRDYFPADMQKNLIALMQKPEIRYISGGHLSTIFRAEEYIKGIRTFLTKACF